MKLCERLGTTMDTAEEQKRRLDAIRGTVREIDRLTFEEMRVTGDETTLKRVAEITA